MKGNIGSGKMGPTDREKMRVRAEKMHVRAEKMHVFEETSTYIHKYLSIF